MHFVEKYRSRRETGFIWLTMSWDTERWHFWNKQKFCAGMLYVRWKLKQLTVNWFIRQLYVYRDMKHAGSLKSTQEATVALGYASSNSYASFVLFKLPTCFISRYTYSWRMNQLTVNCFSFHITYSIPAQNFCLFQKCQRSVSQDVGSRIKPVSRLLRLKWIKIKLDLTCLKSEFRRLISTIYTRQY